MTNHKMFLQIDPSIQVSHSNNPKSLAYPTARTRWPAILRGCLADVEESKSQPERTAEEVNDGDKVLYDIRLILEDMNNDNPIVPIPNDGGSDIEAYNDELESIGPMTWHSSPWLFTENFLYRRLQTCFSLRDTPFWKNYDAFARQKSRALVSSAASILELVQFLDSSLDAAARGQLDNPSDAKALLEEMLDISLWGNSVDLLLLVHLSVEELQSRQGKTARQSFKQNVVDDDTDAACALLAGLRGNKERPREVHIVLDNAGFEFLADLVLVSYLLGAGYASAVVLHGKAIPWFVSDVTARDLEFTLQTLRSASPGGGVEVQSEEEASKLRAFGAAIERHLATGRLRFEAHPFWTTQHCYARMPKYAPDLWGRLAGAELVVFKGDLNYRKLVFDGLWPRTTTFQRALGPLGMAPPEGESGLRILSLRTCKADTVVGLEPGREQEIDSEGTGEWSRNGKYAVISFHDGKSSS